MAIDSRLGQGYPAVRIKVAADGAHLVRIDETGPFLNRLVRRSGARIGQTPVIGGDGEPNHRGPVIREFLRRSTRLRLERLPAYAAERNPVETVWSGLKWGRRANFVPDDPTDLDDGIVEYLVALEHDPKRLRALWERSDLPCLQRPPDQ